MTEHSGIDAVIFDMDGTMIDNMGFHMKAWQQLFLELGLDWDLQQVQSQAFGRSTDVLHRVFPGRFSEVQIAALIHRKEQAYRDVFLPKLRLLAGLPDLLQQLSSQPALKLGIGTGADRPNVDFVLENLGLRSLFQAVVSAEEVQNGKPHPETFLKVAQRLKVRPSHCVVFEDTPSGVEAARSAGMRAVGVTTCHGAAELSGAEFCIPDFCKLAGEPAKWFES